MKIRISKKIGIVKVSLLSILIAFFLVHFSFAQKIADTPALKKYVNTTLFQLDSNFDVSGTWKGNETQFVRVGRNIYVTGRFEYEFELEQDGNRVTGTSFIADGQGNFAEMKLRGILIGNKFHFEEYEIDNELMDLPNSLWCFTTGELDIILYEGKLMFAGPLKGYASDDYHMCDETYVNMVQEDKIVHINHNITDQPTAEEEVQRTRGSMSVFPNPFTNLVTFKYILEETAHVTLEVFDFTGRHIATLVDENQSPSVYNVDFMGEEFESGSGMFIGRLTIGDNVYTSQFVQGK